MNKHIFILFLILFLTGCGDFFKEYARGQELNSINYNTPQPGLMLAALCKNEQSNEVVRKIKYLGSITNFDIAKDIRSYKSEKPCGAQKMGLDSFDFGFLGCRWSAKWESQDGKLYLLSGKLEESKSFFIDADRAWFGHDNIAWMELNAQARR
jgi:hypothetical protein